MQSLRATFRLPALAISAGLIFFACSNDDNGISTPRGQASFTASNLAAGTTPFRKVVASDGQDSAESVTRSFTTM